MSNESWRRPCGCLSSSQTCTVCWPPSPDELSAKAGYEILSPEECLHPADRRAEATSTAPEACTACGAQFAKAGYSDLASAQVEPEAAINLGAKAVHSDRIDELCLDAKAVHSEAGESIGDVIQRAARTLADAPFHPTAVPVVHPDIVEQASAAWFGTPRPGPARTPEEYVRNFVARSGALHHTAADTVGTPVIRGPRDNAGRLRTTTGELWRHDWMRPVETIAHHVPVSREVLGDDPVADSFVRNTIAFRAEAPPTPERAAELAAEREATAARLKRVRARRAARDVARTAARRARGIHPPCTHDARGDDDW